MVTTGFLGLLDTPERPGASPPDESVPVVPVEPVEAGLVGGLGGGGVAGRLPEGWLPS
jgi:hypothetical protein